MPNKFADVYILPIAEDKVAEYKKIANAAGKAFVKHGALKYREYVGRNLDSVAQWGLVPFTKNMKVKEGETVIYAAVEFKSEKHRDQVMKKVMNDPEMKYDDASFDMSKMMKRMVYGGFEIIVDHEAKEEKK